MGSIQNAVRYCCVSRNNQILYVHNEGERETENLAALCLERTPPFHKWYFETIGKRTFGFLVEEDYVYFAIVDEGLGNPGILGFLQHLRDEFRKVARRGSRYSFSGGMSLSGVQEQLLPAIRRLISSLENVTQVNNDSSTSSRLAGLSPSPSDASDQIEVAASTKAPLLGKSSKQEKKKAKDHVIGVRDVVLEEHGKSTDKGCEVGLDCSNQTEPMSLHQDLGPRRRSASQNFDRKWRHQVKLVLAIDAAICLTLFAIWLGVCKGLACTRS